MAHRDYGLDGATVDITVRDDRIEVRSPGPLPGHITIDNMRDEHYSRNPRIMRVLKTVGLVEEYGDGIDRMYREMESRLMEPPAFEATASSVTVTLRNRFLVEVEDQMWLMQLGREDLTTNERRVLVAARASRDGTGSGRQRRAGGRGDEGIAGARRPPRRLPLRSGRGRRAPRRRCRDGTA